VNGRYDGPSTAFAAWIDGPGRGSNLKHDQNLVPGLTGPSRILTPDRQTRTDPALQCTLADPIASINFCDSSQKPERNFSHTTDKANESQREHISRAVERQSRSRRISWPRLDQD
jgi:hypothetical protein